MKVYYLVNRNTKEILSSGPMPETWKNITGLQAVAYEHVSDLTWAGSPGIGFLTEEDARKVPGIDLSVIDGYKVTHSDVEWGRLRATRDDMIADVRWRVERYNDQMALGIKPTEVIKPVLQYIQDLRDVTANFATPYALTWPIEPPELTPAD